MTLSAEHVAELAEHEELCREHCAAADARNRPQPAPAKLYRMSLEHRGRWVKSLVVAGDVTVFAYVDRLPACRGFFETVVSELRAGDKFISADRVWTLTAIQSVDTRQSCTCLGSCRGKEGLGAGWRCVLEKECP